VCASLCVCVCERETERDFCVFVYILTYFSLSLSEKTHKQIFDDMFTDLIFLSVTPFGALFFAMVVFFFIRNIVRDAGLGFVLWDYIRFRGGRGKRRAAVNLEKRFRNLQLRFHLLEQNLFSELLSTLVIPTIVAFDLLMSQVSGFGVNTIAYRLSTSTQVSILEMYLVLLIVEFFTHIVVRALLRRQVEKFQKMVSAFSTRTSWQERAEDGSGSASHWNFKETNKVFWKRNFRYLLAIVVFVVPNVMFSTLSMKHRLSKDASN